MEARQKQKCQCSIEASAGIVATTELVSVTASETTLNTIEALARIASMMVEASASVLLFCGYRGASRAMFEHTRIEET